MGLDGPFAEDQAFGDAGVRHSLCHQPKHFLLAVGELGESVLVGAAVEQRGDDLGVECGASVGDSCDGAEEVRDVQHPVLEQVAEPAQSGELDAVGGLDVLRKEQDAQVWPRGFEGGGGPGALVGERGR